jgi:hypothetical protein
MTNLAGRFTEIEVYQDISKWIRRGRRVRAFNYEYEKQFQFLCFVGVCSNFIKVLLYTIVGCIYFVRLCILANFLSHNILLNPKVLSLLASKNKKIIIFWPTLVLLSFL